MLDKIAVVIIGYDLSGASTLCKASFRMATSLGVMSCSHCDSWMQTYLIRSPAQLREALRIVRKGLDDGELRELPVPTHTSNGVEIVPVAQLLDTSVPWPDVLQARLGCPVCGQQFSLLCETYHGPGGKWTPDAQPVDAPDRLPASSRTPTTASDL